jgi:hypothetical protein
MRCVHCAKWANARPIRSRDSVTRLNKAIKRGWKALCSDSREETFKGCRNSSQSWRLVNVSFGMFSGNRLKIYHLFAINSSPITIFRLFVSLRRSWGDQDDPSPGFPPRSEAGSTCCLYKRNEIFFYLFKASAKHAFILRGNYSIPYIEYQSTCHIEGIESPHPFPAS